jgi:hypothetical protein
MWTVDTTKAPFLGVTGHWIDVEKDLEEIWTMRSEVIGFQTVSGDHGGKNVGRYYVGVCDRIGITDTDQSKVSTTSSDCDGILITFIQAPRPHARQCIEQYYKM